MHGLSPLADSPHLFIVAGYPTLGKSSSLWKAARTRFPLFGSNHAGVVPAAEALAGIRENSPTAAKLKAGFWLTLSDLPQLSAEPGPPQRLILHLDLLLSYLRGRTAGNSAPDVTELVSGFARLFAQPPLQRYEQCTVVSLYAPFEEVQRRWRHRYPAGVPANCSKILAEKDRLITDAGAGAPAFAAIYWAWERSLEALSREGRLAEHFKVMSSLRADLPEQDHGGTTAVPRPSVSGNAPARRSRG